MQKRQRQCKIDRFVVLGKLGKELFKRSERHEKDNDKSDKSNIDKGFFETFFKDGDEV